MRRLAFLVLAACTPAPAPEFDIAALKPTHDPVTLTGWFQPDKNFREFRLYPEQARLGQSGNAACLSGLATSLAGIPTDEFRDKQMSITGTLHSAGGPDVGATKDACGGGLILIAMDISVPD